MPRQSKLPARIAALPRHALVAVLFLGLAGVAIAPLSKSVEAGDAAVVQVKTGAAEVKIDNFTFAPPVLTVAPGTTVTWTNEDDIPHTVTAKEKAFRSKALDTDNAFSFTFTTPGEYEYFCSLHPHMVGKVVVMAGDAASAPH
jgi:plastocyanin